MVTSLSSITVRRCKKQKQVWKISLAVVAFLSGTIWRGFFGVRILWWRTVYPVNRMRLRSCQSQLSFYLTSAVAAIVEPFSVSAGSSLGGFGTRRQPAAADSGPRWLMWASGSTFNETKIDLKKQRERDTKWRSFQWKWSSKVKTSQLWRCFSTSSTPAFLS